jgi:hypothetical protein
MPRLRSEHGLAGQKRAGERCSAVVVLISRNWLTSKWWQVEFLLASQLGKRIFGVIIAVTPFANSPLELIAHYQLADISDLTTKADGFERCPTGPLRRRVFGFGRHTLTTVGLITCSGSRVTAEWGTCTRSESNGGSVRRSSEGRHHRFVTA